MPSIKFDRATAITVLERIREGETVRQICKTRNFPIKATDIYDWLRDGKAKIGKRTFGQAYEEACRDRALTWQDMALETQDMKLKGLKTDYSELKKATDRANLLLRMAKEARESAKSITAGTGGDAINVTIRRFTSKPEAIDLGVDIEEGDYAEDGDQPS